VKIFPTVNVRMNIDKLKNIEKDRMLPKSKTRLAVQRERARLGYL